jgi:hypothetical protein
MTLTYTETQHHTIKKTVEHTLHVPSSWGMFTPQGNSRMKSKADALIRNIEKAGDSYSKKVSAFEKYFKAYRKACNSKSEVMAEAGDTSVRESVWDFATKVGKAVEVGENTLDEIWDQYN